MKSRTTGCLLRIFVGESDRFDSRPLYEAIVIKAREHHLAGATVVHGRMGFGANSRLHTSKILRLSEDLPIIVEIVDTHEKIELFLPALDAMVAEGLVTIESIEVVWYRPGETKDAPDGPHRS